MCWKGASGVATLRELKFRRSFEPPAPAPSSGDGRGDRDVRPQRSPSPARAAEGASGEVAADATPPLEAASQPAKRGRAARKQ